MSNTKIFGANHGIATSNVIPDNNATALDIESTDAKDYITIDTTDGDERIKFAQEVTVPDGAVNNPSLRFTGHNSGFYDSGGNGHVGLVIDGSRVFDFADTYFNRFDVSKGFEIDTTAGTATNPVFTFNGDDDTGVGTSGDDRLSLIAGGTEALRLGGGGVIGKLATALTSGTVSTSGSSTTLNGSSTVFKTDFHVGAAIKVGTVTTTVTAITSDTELTLQDAIDTGVTGTTCTRDSGELFAVKTGDSKTLFSIQPTGVIGAGANANSNTGVYNNLGIGDPTMFDKLTTGNALFVMGNQSGDYDFTTANASVIIGYNAAAASVNSQNLIAIGTYAADTDTNIRESVIIGSGAGRSSGNDSVHIGQAAGASCTGVSNVSVGREALDNSSAATESVAVGYQSLSALTGSVESNTGLGFQSGLALTSGQQCTFLGAEATTSAATLNNQTAIGFGATTDAANQVRVGNTSVSDIDGQVALTATSDARVKTNVQDLNLGLEFINALRPVSFSRVHPADWPEEIRDERYKKGRTVVDEDGNEAIVSTANFDVETQQPIKEEFDSTTRSDGLIAQEVKAACETLGVEFNGIKENSSGKMGIQYSLLVAPLIKAVQELTARIEQLEGGD